LYLLLLLFTHRDSNVIEERERERTIKNV